MFFKLTGFYISKFKHTGLIIYYYYSTFAKLLCKITKAILSTEACFRSSAVFSIISKCLSFIASLFYKLHGFIFHKLHGFTFPLSWRFFVYKLLGVRTALILFAINNPNQDLGELTHYKMIRLGRYCRIPLCIQ